VREPQTIKQEDPSVNAVAIGLEWAVQSVNVDRASFVGFDDIRAVEALESIFFIRLR
jgi:hypothetical protein